jgi:hypothetical protein
LIYLKRLLFSFQRPDFFYRRPLATEANFIESFSNCQEPFSFLFQTALPSTHLHPAVQFSTTGAVLTDFRCHGKGLFSP